MAEREGHEQVRFLLINQRCLFGGSDDAHANAYILRQKETRRSGSQWRVRLGKIVDGAPEPQGLPAYRCPTQSVILCLSEGLTIKYAD
jgi:hypothetical protein